jgi:hypothetical protein
MASDIQPPRHTPGVLQLVNLRDSTKRDRFIGTMTLAGVLSLMAIAIGCQGFSGSPLSFVLKFPQTVDLGELWLVEDVNCFTCGTGEKYLGRAIGEYDISLPAAHWFVSLRMPKNVSPLLPHLADHPSLSNIGDINLESSNVSDDDLKYLAPINLRSINLSKTGITGKGLGYLRPNKKWSFVELRDCIALDPKYLAHFKGWRRSTIRLVSYKWTGEVHSERELKLLDMASQMICDHKPESLCGTQIR